jgi:methyl-accepting chemotaxis protein
MQLNQWKIGPRLALGFGVVVALMVAIVAITVTRLHGLHSDSAMLLDLQQRAATAGAWRNAVHLNTTRTLAIVKSGGNADVIAYFEGPMKATSEGVNDLQKQLTQSIDSDKGKALLTAIATQRSSYMAIRADLLAKLKGGDIAAGQDMVNSKMVPAIDTYIASIDALARYQDARVKERGEQLAADVQQAAMLALGLLATAVVAALGLGWCISRSITGPLRRTQQAAEHIAAGDLAQPVHVEGRDEAADMQRALQGMQQSLRKLVGDVRAGSDSIGTASAQIASGNQDLSSRTEQTSSSLQQAASNLEELTGTVSQTAESARTANQLAASASTAAQRGGSVVAQVVSTMEEINQSSRRIADIIGTIDGIAFQTNILALNAAVEAARAGEQGRGFAVVAGEVRSLAQRSATAAREIKSLIQASVDKVDTGAQLVQDAGSAMRDSVDGVQRVTDVIAEISAATSAQSNGLRVINDAVSGLDQMTQQNAALVEQSAAAAESMAEQSRSLGRVVAMFKVGAGAGARSTPLAAPAAAVSPALVLSAPAAPPTPAKALAGKVLSGAARRAKEAKAVPAPHPAAAASAPVAAPAAAVPAARSTSADTGDWETF